jgi:methylenetetrahydrofolate dehydrogenase (NADP+)/methenyltetrahydrofolate cyclohydrolase
MAATIMDGKALAERLRDEVRAEVGELGGGIGLATVLVGDDPASSIYVRRKREACAEVGIESIHHELPVATEQDELVALVEELNADDRVTGILCQLPLPDHVDESTVIRTIEPVKDVDGFHPLNAGLLLQGAPALVPATPAGIMELLAAYDIALAGARAVVIGRSNIVGKPISVLLLGQNATVTICHSKTRDLPAVAREADVLVAAIGRAAFVTPDMVKPGAAVVDVGINRVEGRVVGDVAPEAAEIAGHFTPVPGGVGPLTIAALLRNTVKAARFQRGMLAYQGR